MENTSTNSPSLDQQIIDLETKLRVALRMNDEFFRDHFRYEAVRKMNVRQFSDVYNRNLRGENFDDMIDEIASK